MAFQGGVGFVGLDDLSLHLAASLLRCRYKVQAFEGCIELGVRKFNVNTEVRKAYMDSLRSSKKDLVHVLESAKQAMKAVIAEKMTLFGSAGKAWN